MLALARRRLHKQARMIRAIGRDRRPTIRYFKSFGEAGPVSFIAGMSNGCTLTAQAVIKIAARQSAIVVPIMAARIISNP